MEQVILAKNGDEKAFRKLIEETKSMLHRTAFAYTKHEDDEDVGIIFIIILNKEDQC